MVDTDRTAQVGENTIYLNEEDMFFLTIVGEIDDKIAVDFIKALEELEVKFEKRKRNLFIDNNNAGKITSKARKIFHELDNRETTGKVAVFGLHPVARVLASFYMGVSRNKKMRFFTTKEDALDWLRE